MLAAIKADYFDNLVDTAKFTIELDSVDLVFDDNLTVIEEGGVEMVEICMIITSKTKDISEQTYVLPKMLAGS